MYHTEHISCDKVYPLLKKQKTRLCNYSCIDTEKPYHATLIWFSITVSTTSTGF